MHLSKLLGLREGALLGVMVYSFARVGAVLAMDVADYCQSGRRGMFRLHEKGGKEHIVPAHHNAEEYLEAYLDGCGLGNDKKAPLFQSVSRARELTGARLHRVDVFRLIKRWARHAGLPETTCCHTFRATGNRLSQQRRDPGARQGHRRPRILPNYPTLRPH